MVSMVTDKQKYIYYITNSMSIDIFIFQSCKNNNSIVLYILHMTYHLLHMTYLCTCVCMYNYNYVQMITNG